MAIKRVLVFAAAVFVSLVAVAAALAAGYWFFQGNLSGAVFNPSDGYATDWARQSFDNTNHPGHTQYITVIDRSGSWHSIGQSCPVTQSGCDSGDLGFDTYTYPKGGCRVPGSYGYAVWTNCKYNHLYP